MQMLRSDWLSHLYTISHYCAVAGTSLWNDGIFFVFSKVLDENLTQMNNLIPEKTKRRTFTVSQNQKMWDYWKNWCANAHNFNFKWQFNPNDLFKAHILIRRREIVENPQEDFSKTCTLKQLDYSLSNCEIETRVEVWENENYCGNTSRRRLFPQLFRFLPNFHECFYNSIEARRTCFLFKKKKTTRRKLLIFIIKM